MATLSPAEEAQRKDPRSTVNQGGAPADRRLNQPAGGRAQRRGGGVQGDGATAGQGLSRPQGAQDLPARKRAHEQLAAAQGRGAGAALEGPAARGGPAQVAEQPGDRPWSGSGSRSSSGSSRGGCFGGGWKCFRRAHRLCDSLPKIKSPSWKDMLANGALTMQNLTH